MYERVRKKLERKEANLRGSCQVNMLSLMCDLQCFESDRVTQLIWRDVSSVKKKKKAEISHSVTIHRLAFTLRPVALIYYNSLVCLLPHS